MNKRTLLVSLVVSIVLPALARAELVATPLSGDSRLVQFEYDPDQTYLILGRPRSVTHVEFAPDEKIVTVAAGDSKNWELTPTANKRHLFIKPTYDQTETSMTVLTDKRSYQFVLRSTSGGAKWYQRVTWRRDQTMMLDVPPAEEDKPAQNLERRQDPSETFSPEKLNFGFSITGEAEFKPLSVFDDGRFTWIKLPAAIQEMPALFALVDGSDFQLVNYVVKGEYIVAQKVITSGVLKLGKAEVRFARKPASKNFWN